MKTLFAKIILFIFLVFSPVVLWANTPEEEKSEDINVRELILEHIGDDYEWHIATLGHWHITVPLPVIVHSKHSGWNVFFSSKLHHGNAYNGFYISHEEKYKGKIVENIDGEAVRPFDFSITKNAFALLFGSILLVFLILICARWYKKRENRPETANPRGFVAFVELVVMSIVNDVIKPCIGKNYRRYTPYLLTIFFFIIFNNLLGLIPFFPFGANITGNIAVTCVLALCTFLYVNIFATREYWREIFWPEVPTWLKVPVPIMPAVEFLGIFTKPFALMIRLFASILAGHALLLGLTCIVFLTVRLGVALNSGMIAFSVILSVFSTLVEILVAYIQAYVFTMLSAIYIGLSQVEPHHAKN